MIMEDNQIPQENRIGIPYQDAFNNNAWTINVAGTLLKLPTELDFKQATRKDGTAGNMYGRAQALVTYADGTQDKVSPVIWQGAIERAQLTVGDEVILRTQMEGEYKGASVVALASAPRVNVDKLALPANWKEEAVAAMAAVEAKE